MIRAITLLRRFALAAIIGVGFLAVGPLFAQEARGQALELHKRGNAALSAGKYEDAIRLYSSAIQADAEFAPSYINRGLALKNLKAYKEAFTDLEKAVRLAPDSAAAYHNRADVHVALGNYPKAQADIKKAFDLYKDPPSGAYLSRGLVHYRLGEDDKALADYSRALRKDPKNATVYNNRSLIWRQKGDDKRALADLDAAAKLNPKDPKPHYNRSTLFLAKGENDKTIEACTKALAIDPRYAQAYHNRGLAHQNKDDYEKAIGDYNNALAVDPNLTQSYINRGVVFFRQRFLVQAIEDLSRAIKLEGKSSFPYYHRGQCLAAQGKQEEAVNDYTKAIELAPKNANAYFARAESYKNLGKTDLADADLAKAKELGPNKKRSAPRRGLVARIGPSVTAGETDTVAAVEHPLQRSTGYVVARKDGQTIGRGTCWLLDKKRRWVVTNDHVVSGHTEFYIFFPQYDDRGRVFTRTAHYLKRPKQIRAWLVATDPRRDVAILQLASVPDGVPAIPLATDLPKPGDVVHSVGNSGTSYRSLEFGTLWTYKRGKVADVIPFLVNIAGSYRFEAGVVRTASGTRPGDSGGPMVNDKGQLVGVVATGERGEAIMCNAISVIELKKFIHEGTKKLNAGKKTFVGVWRYTFTTEKGKIYLRYTFKEDGTAIEEGFKSAVPGRYEIKDDSLILSFPGYKPTVKISWETNDKFKAAFAKGVGEFERW